LQQQLADERPEDLERKADLAGTHLSLGRTFSGLGQSEAAVSSLGAALGLYEALDRGLAKGVRFRTERVATLVAMGRAYAKAGEAAESTAASEAALGELSAAIREKPEDPRGWIDRALFFIRRREESRADADLLRAWHLDPGADYWSRPVLWAALALYTGDRQEYRRECRRLLREFGQTSDAICRLYLAITLGLGDDAVDDWAHVVAMTQDTLSELNEHSSYYHDLTLVYLRAGRLEDALRTLDKADRIGWGWPARTLNDPLRAIICHRLGRHAEARTALEKARRWAEANVRKGPPELTSLDLVGDWYRHLILLREAEALIVYDPAFPADPFAR
jgi:tetratricopeptide (TPR) repeat protein